jgi:hypothetical protein
VKELKSPSRGRPKTPLVQRLRVIVWSHWVMDTSGSTLIQELESRLQQRSRKVRLSKGLWARYMRGEVLPQGARAEDSTTLIDRIEAIYPGTSRIFHSPIWELMDFDKVLGPHELKDMYLRLGKETWTRFVSNHWFASTAVVAASRYWKIRHSGEELISHLQTLTGLEGLSACLIEARLGYLRQEESLFMGCMLAGRQLITALAHSAQFATPKMQSALFLIEGLWIAHVRQQVIAPPHVREVESQVSNLARAWERDWAEMSRNHCDTLPKASRATFEKWRVECAPFMPFR